MSTNRKIIDEVSITSQGICIIDDDILGPSKGVLLVYNRRIAGDGKPAGGGLPGGSSERILEDPQDALWREFRDETGFPILEYEELFEADPKIIIEQLSETGVGPKIIEIERQKLGFQPVGKEERRLYRDVLCRDVELDWINEMLSEALRKNKIKLPDRMRGERRILNRIFIYKVKVQWEGSPLQKLLIRRETNCIMFDELSAAEITSLNIKETDEIGGIGIFALEDALSDMRGELIYPSHRKRLLRGLELMNILTTP